MECVWHSTVTLSLLVLLSLWLYLRNIPLIFLQGLGGSEWRWARLASRCFSCFFFSLSYSFPRGALKCLWYSTVTQLNIVSLRYVLYVVASFNCSGVNVAVCSWCVHLLLWHLFSIFLKIDPRPAAAGLQSYSGLGRVGEGCLWWVMGIGWGRVCWVGWGMWMINTGVRIWEYSAFRRQAGRLCSNTSAASGRLVVSGEL